MKKTTVANNQGYYLHHTVVCPSQPDKLRVVFDALAITSNRSSLNDILLTWPIQEDLFSILLRFCTKNLVFATDVIKMYTVQVSVSSTQISDKIPKNTVARGWTSTFRHSSKVTYGKFVTHFLLFNVWNNYAQGLVPLEAKSSGKKFLHEWCANWRKLCRQNHEAQSKFN